MIIERAIARPTPRRRGLSEKVWADIYTFCQTVGQGKAGAMRASLPDATMRALRANPMASKLAVALLTWQTRILDGERARCPVDFHGARPGADTRGGGRSTGPLKKFLASVIRQHPDIFGVQLGAR